MMSSILVRYACNQCDYYGQVHRERSARTQNLREELRAQMEGNQATWCEVPWNFLYLSCLSGPVCLCG